jgi:hypothetical protein
MYSIGNIIFGIPLTEEIMQALGDDEAEEMGFEVLYSGSADFMPGYMGVELGTIDECQDEDLDDPEHPMNRKPTAQQIAEVQERVEAFVKKMRKIDKDVTIPDIRRWLVWSTS